MARGLVRQVSGRAPRTGRRDRVHPITCPRHRPARSERSAPPTRTARSGSWASWLTRALGTRRRRTPCRRRFPLPDRRTGTGGGLLAGRCSGELAADPEPQPARLRRPLALGVPESAAPVSRSPRLSDNYSPINAKSAATATLIGGMALLEIVLLAGPAFAVSARRQRRELALVAAVGGPRQDLRNVVLSKGIVLGVIGGMLSVFVAVALTAIGIATLGRYVNAIPGHFDVRPVELLALALVSLTTALAAAVFPARGAARTDSRGRARRTARHPAHAQASAVARRGDRRGRRARCARSVGRFGKRERHPRRCGADRDRPDHLHADAARDPPPGPGGGCRCRPALRYATPGATVPRRPRQLPRSWRPLSAVWPWPSVSRAQRPGPPHVPAVDTEQRRLHRPRQIRGQRRCHSGRHARIPSRLTSHDRGAVDDSCDASACATTDIAVASAGQGTSTYVGGSLPSPVIDDGSGVELLLQHSDPGAVAALRGRQGRDHRSDTCARRPNRPPARPR